MTTQVHSLFLAIRSHPCTRPGQNLADPIYREITLRTLANDAHDPLPRVPATWLTPDGQLHDDVLLRALLDFWRQHGKSLYATARDHALTPYLVLSAFLRRVVTGDSREYAIGWGRMNRCVRYQGETLAIETKVWRPQKTDPLRDGLNQIDAYLVGLGLNAGWLAISDCPPDAPVLPGRACAALATTRDGQEVTWISRLGGAPAQLHCVRAGEDKQSSALCPRHVARAAQIGVQCPQCVALAL